MRNLFKALKQDKQNNSGSTIILVIIAIAFVATLVTILIYTSYYNFAMKNTDRKSKDNFYSAETALDEINAGLQRVVSDAMREGYTQVMQNGSSLSPAAKQEMFANQYIDAVIREIQTTASKTNVVKKYRISEDTNGDGVPDKGLKFYLVNTAYKPATKVGAEILTTDSESLIDVPGNVDNLLYLKDLKIRYTDDKGYVSLITTDIRIQVPTINFSATATVPELDQFSLIANERLLIGDAGQVLNVDVTGNVYGGKESLEVTMGSKVNFIEDAKDPANTVRRLIANNIYAQNNVKRAGTTIETSKSHQTWVNNIIMDSAATTFRGYTYVKDDMELDGRGSKSTLEGTFYGFGSTVDNSALGSSSILINGAYSSLDFTKLQNLFLSGHAYIGAKHYDINKKVGSVYGDDYLKDLEDTVSGASVTLPQNPNDVLMGQSIALKSDQSLYMVPVECMGYDNKTGLQVLGKNPLSFEEYEKLEYIDIATNTKPYTSVRTDLLMKKIGKSMDAYGATYRPVFRRVSGSVLVYYYLFFQSTEMANQFFYDYYQADKAAASKYVKTYLADFKWNSALGNVTGNELRLAGNAISYNANKEVVIRKDTVAEDATMSAQIMAEQQSLTNQYFSWNRKLVQNINGLSSVEMNQDVFTNIVVDKMTYTSLLGMGKTFSDGITNAYVVDGNFVVDSSNNANTGLVLATGDVEVKADFEGLIIAGGKITIWSGCNYITYNANRVRAAMALQDGGVFVSSFFKDGNAYANYQSTTLSGNSAQEAVARKADYIEVSDLVQYENWKKE